MDRLMRTSLCALLAVTAASACTPARTALPASSGPRDRVRAIFAEIDMRNRTVKRSDAWLREAYRTVAGRSLRGIPTADYGRYRRFARDGKAYIIVHPAYFPFFDEWTMTPVATDYGSGLPRKNLVERVSDLLRPTDVAYQVALQQERVIRDFIEFMSVEKHLTILVLPRDYRDHLTYSRTEGYDEYARYLNELTNGAENIITVQSDGHDNGFLRENDLAALGDFLDAAGVRQLLLGGGFLGTCLDNFAASLRRRYTHDQIWYVRDLTTISPSAVVADRSRFLSFWGVLRQQRLREYVVSIPFNRTTSEPLRWADLSLYAVSRDR